MKRIILMMLRNILVVPIYWIKLCYYASHIDKYTDEYINKFLSMKEPTRELIINLVEKIYIYQDKTIDIIFTFKNVT